MLACAKRFQLFSSNQLLGSKAQFLLVGLIDVYAAQAIPVVKRGSAEQTATLKEDIGPELFLSRRRGRLPCALSQRIRNPQELPPGLEAPPLKRALPSLIRFA